MESLFVFTRILALGLLNCCQFIKRIPRVFSALRGFEFRIIRLICPPSNHC